MKGRAETAGLDEIIQEMRTKRMKARTWVLPTLQDCGRRNGGIHKDMKVMARIREMGQYKVRRKGRKTFEEERGGCGFSCSKKFK